MAGSNGRFPHQPESGQPQHSLTASTTTSSGRFARVALVDLQSELSLVGLINVADVKSRPSEGAPVSNTTGPTESGVSGKSDAGERVGTDISLVLIDDNRLLREGIAALIHLQPGFRVLVSSADVDEAMEIVREAKPDVVLVDFGLEDSDSLALTATVGREVPTAKVIVMGLVPTQEDVADYVRAGATGFVMKDATFEEFFATIRSVAAGLQVLPKALTTSLFAQIVRNEVTTKGKSKTREAVRLTNREREVIDLLAEGLSNKQISARLHIAIHTVKSHVHNVLEKLSLHSRLEVAAFTHARGGAKDLDL